MRKALSIHLGQKHTQVSFPVFYALDLVQFGVSKKVPEAVRLGERLLSEQGARMPSNLARAVREMLLDQTNQQRYREGIKITGL